MRVNPGILNFGSVSRNYFGAPLKIHSSILPLLV